MTLRRTIVYRSRYHRAPVTVLTTFKTKRLGRVKDSFNKISSEKQMPLQRVLDNSPITLYVILSKDKTLIKSSTYTFKILPLPPQHARIKQPQQPGKKCSPERAIDAYWYGYCFRIEVLAK